MVSLAPATAQEHRAIVHRSVGTSHGPITRLASPGDLGELIKPFVFLDRFEWPLSDGKGFPIHPHSGIATHTTLLAGGLSYQDSTSASGMLGEGGIEWMRAGGGVWHGGNPEAGKPVRGYQLWIALGEGLEHSPAESQYVLPEQIPSVPPVRVLLGQYGAARSVIADVAPITYLDVRLKHGESWRYQPPPGHQVAWVAVHDGALGVSGTQLRREIAVFEEGETALDFVADGDTAFVLGSAAKHPHSLVLGYHSVHTSPAALARGEAGIKEIRARLIATGALG